jgi:hypothetical protein
MVMKRWIVAVFTLTAFVSSGAQAGETIYKSKNKIDFIKLEKAKKAEREGGISHPFTFTPDQMRSILSSVRFNKKIMLMKDIENRDLFDEANVEFLTPYLVEAFQKAKPEEAVVVSYFTRGSKLMVQNDRLTVMRAFVKDDGLHIKFTKIYAKMLGDRTTQGAAAASSNARGLRVSLELQPGQNRVSLEPEELTFDLAHYSAAVVAEKAVPKKEKAKTTSSQKEVVDDTSVRSRLKELDQLKADGVITEKEYQAKRKEVLKEL